jgi:hypothetical protein
VRPNKKKKKKSIYEYNKKRKKKKMVVVRGVQLGWRGPGSGERDIAKKKKNHKKGLAKYLQV